MFPTLEPQLARYRELEQQLYDEKIAADPTRAGAIAKERGTLAKTVEPYIEYKRLCDAIAESEKLAASGEADPRLQALLQRAWRLTAETATSLPSGGAGGQGGTQ